MSYRDIKTKLTQSIKIAQCFIANLKNNFMVMHYQIQAESTGISAFKGKIDYFNFTLLKIKKSYLPFTDKQSLKCGTKNI